MAGPTPDSLDDEDIDKLPIDLQYLDETKKVEEDVDIRKLLLESLLQVLDLLLRKRYKKIAEFAHLLQFKRLLTCQLVS